MVLRKATAATEAGASPTPEQRAGLLRLADETTRDGVHLVSETLRPSSRGRRYRNSRDGVSYFDGPFAETKELVGGYVIVSAGSLEEAGRWRSGISRPWTRRKWTCARWRGPSDPMRTGRPRSAAH